MKINSTVIDDTFAEAFPMQFARLIVTAHDQHWLDAAVNEFAGFSSSVIACDLEIGRDGTMAADDTPDGRLGAALLAFGFSAKAMTKSLPIRAGQCIMTCPTTAMYDGLPACDTRIPLGKHVRFFGDGFQKSKLINGRRYWRIPVMDGEFVVEEKVGLAKGVAGGNIIIQGDAIESALDSARRGVDAVARIPGAVTPFPGGVVRSGSKVGSRYKALKASTSDPFCPTLRGRVSTKLHDGVNAALEIVIDGVDEQTVGKAMAAAIRAAAGPGVIAVTAGNYGGNLGPHHFHLHELLNEHS